MPLVFDHAQVPPGGYDFRDPSGVPFLADRLRDLVDRVTAFRVSNGFPPGNPEAEIEADYRVRYPWLCTKVGTAPVVKEDPIARWLNRQWRAPTKERDFAESTLTAARLGKCATCEFYVPTHSYDPEVRRRLTILGYGRLTDEGACSVHHWAVGLAAMQQAPETAYAPEGCWVSGIVP